MPVCPGITRAVDLASHLGLMAAECELEAAMYPEFPWYVEFLTNLGACYRESQLNVLDDTNHERVRL